jgi:hypothetical protein
VVASQPEHALLGELADTLEQPHAEPGAVAQVLTPDVTI